MVQIAMDQLVGHWRQLLSQRVQLTYKISERWMNPGRPVPKAVLVGKTPGAVVLIEQWMFRNLFESEMQSLG